MQIIVESKYLAKLMADAYKTGYTECQHILAPLSDEVRQCDVKEWLKSMGLDYRTFLRLKRNGVLRPFRKGERINSALYYWRSEIIKAFDKVLHSKEAPNTFHVFEQQDLIERIAEEARKVSMERAMNRSKTF